MKKVLVFGTGGSAENLMRLGGEIYDVVAFIDNDRQKQGKEFYGRPIYAPEVIGQLEYEAIIVASMWYNEIRQQLIEKCGVSEKTIRRKPKAFASIGKQYRPFEDPETIAYARHVLKCLCGLLVANEIPYFVDHGTLLGLVRDGDLIPWDDDIDLSVDYAFRMDVYQVISQQMHILPDPDRMTWKVEIIYNSLDEDVAIMLTPKDRLDSINPFNVGISFFRHHNGLALEAINWAPRRHYDESAWIETKLGRFRAPNDYETYLSIHYGDWKTPFKDIAFSEIGNFKRPEAPACWLPWNGSVASEGLSVLKAMRKGPVQGDRLNVVMSMAQTEDLGGGEVCRRIHANSEQLERSLVSLAKVLHLRSVVICVVDPSDFGDICEILSLIHRIGIADDIRVEMDVLADPSEELLAVLASVEARVILRCDEYLSDTAANRCTFMWQSGLPCTVRTISTAEATMPCELYPTLTLNTIRHLRCQYKRWWTLWNDVLSRCPKALTIATQGRSLELNADVIQLREKENNLKSSLLAMFRRKPCAACDGCTSNGEVWKPYCGEDSKSSSVELFPGRLR